ncbi:MAG: hypothetical protein ACJAT2_000688 [Bacteriovoracaceae bacterium]|jgi:hypothetical protein
MRAALFIFLISFCAFGQEDFPNPIWEDRPKEEGKVLRTGTWNLGGKGPVELKSQHPFSLVKNIKKNIEIAFEMMKKQSIDIMCLTNIKRKKYKTPTGFKVEPAEGSIIFDGVNPHYEEYYFIPGPMVHEKYDLKFTYEMEYNPVVYNSKKLNCVTPLPNSKPLGLSPKRSVHVLYCKTTDKKFRFNFSCAHAPEKGNALREILFGLDQMNNRAPLTKIKHIFAGSYNSYPGKHKAPTNPNAKDSIGWYELEVPSPSSLKIRPFQNEGGTFNKLSLKNGSLHPSAITDDILHSPDLDKNFLGKSVIPVQVFPLNPKGTVYEILKKKKWYSFYRFSDHLPIKADYSYD